MDDNDDIEGDDSLKVFVSRLPSKWKKENLEEHFQNCFGNVSYASVLWDEDKNCSRGYGYVTFTTEDAKQRALLQGSLHAKHKTIQIRPISRETSNICFLWQKNICPRGDSCKFSHEGPGGCIATSMITGGGKKCISFRLKGKCSKGDGCPFLHVSHNRDTTNHSVESLNNNFDEKQKLSVNNVCFKFSKKGFCRKGEACKYLHAAVAPISAGGEIGNNANMGTLESEDIHESSLGKRKKIDGAELVRRKKERESRMLA
jgi:RNA recognition motif-containing protein